jgi:hypothetical protein
VADLLEHATAARTRRVYESDFAHLAGWARDAAVREGVAVLTDVLAGLSRDGNDRDDGVDQAGEPVSALALMEVLVLHLHG